MPEGQGYDPTIEEHMHTTGINTGRLQNTELTREIADQENWTRDHGGETDPDRFARTKIIEESMQGNLPDAQDVYMATPNEAMGWSPDEVASRRQALQEQFDKAVDHATATAEQYDQLQSQAKNIAEAVTGKPTPDASERFSYLEDSGLLRDPITRSDGQIVKFSKWSEGGVVIECGHISSHYSGDELAKLGGGDRAKGLARLEKAFIEDNYQPKFGRSDARLFSEELQ